MRSAVDPAYGVLRPLVDRSGTPSGIPRGSYAAWNNIYLYHVDRPLAREQYEGLRRHFLVRLPFGACAVREYPHGVRAAGDVDSGPVLFGLSTSGTGFAVASARYFEDAAVLDGLLRTAEAVGSSFDSARGRRYLAAPLVGDAIMLAMKTAREWDGRFVAHPRPEDPHLNGHVGGLPD